MDIFQSRRSSPGGAETVEQTLDRLQSRQSELTEPEVLRPSRWMRLGNLILPSALVVLSVSTLSSRQPDDLESWASRAVAALCLIFGSVWLLSSVRGRVLLTPEGLRIRTIRHERTIPWREVSEIDMSCDHSWEERDQHSLALTTTRGESIRLPGFRTMFWMYGRQTPPSIVAAAYRIEVWRRCYDPSSTAVWSAPAGWYPDPTHGGHLRYWDGSAWTDRFAPDAGESAPGVGAGVEGIDQLTAGGEDP
jgi:Protein of unknown function (DUF2510)